MPGDRALNILDLHPFRLLRPDQVANGQLRHFHGHRLSGELVVRQQPIERAVKVTAVVGHGLGDEDEHRCGHVETGMMRARGSDAALEDFQPQLLLERSDLDHEPAREPRADAVLEALQIARRPVGGHNDLAAESRPAH